MPRAENMCYRPRFQPAFSLRTNAFLCHFIYASLKGNNECVTVISCNKNNAEIAFHLHGAAGVGSAAHVKNNPRKANLPRREIKKHNLWRKCGIWLLSVYFIYFHIARKTCFLLLAHGGAKNQAICSLGCLSIFAESQCVYAPLSAQPQRHTIKQSQADALDKKRRGKIINIQSIAITISRRCITNITPGKSDRSCEYAQH